MCDFFDENDYLIHLIKCAIHNEQPCEIPDVEWFDTVYQSGVYHHVANIAFYSVEKLERKPNEALYREWEKCRDRAVVREFTQTFARDEIIDAFEQAEIRYLEPQGTQIKNLYPYPEYRTMSDLDFIIDPDNLPKARDLLEGLFYECQDVDDVEVDGFRPPNINIEVHTAYFPENSPFYSVMRPPFASVEETGRYDLNELYIYNFLHIAKHYTRGGFGIRRVLDVYFLNLNYGDKIHQQYVSSVFQSAKTEAFVDELIALANQWFAHGQTIAERSELANFVLSSGLHGTWNHFFTSQFKSSYQNEGAFFRVKYFFRRLIGTKKIMYAKYPVLNRWKVLYPFCWIHRLFSALKPSKRKKIGEELKIVISTDLNN